MKNFNKFEKTIMVIIFIVAISCITYGLYIIVSLFPSESTNAMIGGMPVIVVGLVALYALRKNIKKGGEER